MLNLIISVLAIALQAVSLFCLVHYVPKWTKAAPEHAQVFAAGITSFEHAYYRYGQSNGGGAPAATLAPDGGLSQLQKPVGYLPFMPPAPEGLSWKYGQSSDHYVCLHVSDGASGISEDVYRALKQLRQYLPDDQYVLSAGANACGSIIQMNADPAQFPAPVTATYFMRYVPNQLPSAAAIPCTGNECLIYEGL